MKCLAVLFATAAVLPTLSRANPTELVMAEIHAPGHVIVRAEEFMGKRLEELTKGELKIKLAHSAQWGSEDKSWKDVRTGQLDMARINFAALVNEVPAARLVSLPYIFRDRSHMWRVLDGDFGKRLVSEAESIGAVILAYFDSGTRSFYSSKKHIRFRSDFEGQRIRVQNSPIYKDLITLLGGTPVVISYDKVLAAFKSGEIDAAENNLTSYVTSEHYKYAKYLSLDEHSSVPEVLVISKKAWDAMTAEQRRSLTEAAREASDYMKKLWAESEASAMATAKANGSLVREKSDIAMNGIETYATQLYEKYVTNQADLGAILAIMRTK